MKKILTLSIIVTTSAFGSAQVLYSSLGAGDSYNTGAGATISGATSIVGAEFIQGFSFVSGASASASSLKIAMGHVTGTTSVTMTLYTESGGMLGSQVGSAATLTTLAGSFGTANALVNQDVSGLGWNLTSGTTYFLVAKSANDAWHAWNDNVVGATGIRYVSSNGSPSYGSGSNVGAFELAAVPEPATLAILGGSLLAFARRKRK